jgi:hypothetical protein
MQKKRMRESILFRHELIFYWACVSKMNDLWIIDN